MPEAALHSTRHRWRQAQAASDQVWTLVRPQALYRRPVPERHRLIFYLGHLEAFDWNLLAPLFELPAFHAEWDRLFAFGIDPVDGQLPGDLPRDWPGVGEVMTYNREVRDRLDDAIEAGKVAPVAAELEQRLQVALEHRWMHVETLSYLLHNLDYKDKHQGPGARPGAKPGAGTAAARGVGIAAGTATLGQPRDRDFGWDNEFDEWQVTVPEFESDRFKVSNGAYLEFVEAGAAAPHFWVRRSNQWYYRGMFGEIELPLDQPVYVTHAEATAYAGWRGKSLPSEAQWHRMAYGAPEGSERRYPWGDAPPTPHRGNFNLVEWDPVAGGSYPAGASAWGVQDLLGNGWEWTRTPFEPFPGFVPFAFYPGYSANFFDGKHYVIKGASARTAECFLRRSFRNWFQPNYPHVYAGFRCVSR